MIQSIPLQAIPNQQLTFGINNQTFNITITSQAVNAKTLQNNTPDPDANTVIYTFASVFLGSTPIIQNAICNHAVYLNQYPSDMQGYLFFYVEGATLDPEVSDKVIYTGFGNNINLWYSDYDALALDYAAWVKANQQSLALEYIYDANSFT